MGEWAYRSIDKLVTIRIPTRPFTKSTQWDAKDNHLEARKEN
jgi:hypothetical protein